MFKNIVIVILLMLGLFWPIIGIFGLLIMWFWTKWPKRLKIFATVLFGLIFCFYLLLYIFLFQYRPFQVNGIAMAPNYNHGSFFITRLINPQNINLSRGDIIIFKSPNNPELDYIKRIIGLPGDFVTLKLDGIYINDQKLDESKYLPAGTQTTGGAFITEGNTINIPPGQYFTLGDNRTKSTDSREWGLVPKENIISRVAFCYWHCSKK